MDVGVYYFNQLVVYNVVDFDKGTPTMKIHRASELWAQDVFGHTFHYNGFLLRDYGNSKGEK